MPRARSIFALALLVRAAPAHADDGEVIVIVDDTAARDRDRALGEAPFVTVLHPDEHGAAASVADAVATAVGAQSRSLGGLGAFASISVRGQPSGQTEVLVDGVPLARIAAVTTDLGRFQLDAFGEVDLYRGAVPVELGGAGVGGALNLVTRLGRDNDGARLRASLGMGSFGARHARLHYGDDHGGVRSSTTVGYVGATGDYSYFDNNGTLLNAKDDAYRVRHNNGFDQLDAATRVGDAASAGGLRLAWKHQGLPGSVAQPAMAASLATVDAIADARTDIAVGPAIARELGYLLVESQHLHDPDAELGLGTQDRAYLTLSGGASSTWIAPVGSDRATVGVELRGDRFRDRDEHGVKPSVTGDRLGGAVLGALDLNLAPQLVVTPAFRADAVRTNPAPITVGAMPMAEAPRWDLVPSPRLSARLAVADDLALKGSAGWYVRLPTLLELFGDRGYILGAPDLKAERGPSADFGGVWAPAGRRGPVDRILVEADAFATRARDTIALVTSAGFVARAQNIGQTQTYGAELVMSARLWRTLSLTASYTRLVTEQISGDENVAGKPIPRAPAHLLYARTDLAVRGVDIWLDAGYQSASALDPAGLGSVPARTIIGTGARVPITAGFTIAVSLDNALDTRISNLPLVPPPSPTFTTSPTPLSDVAGFPLPGRSFYLTLQWSH